MRVLDLGCGSGRDLAKWGVSASDQVTGLDIEKTYLLLAKARFRNRVYVQGAGECLPFRNESFDRILSAIALPCSLFLRRSPRVQSCPGQPEVGAFLLRRRTPPHLIIRSGGAKHPKWNQFRRLKRRTAENRKKPDPIKPEPSSTNVLGSGTVECPPTSR